MWINTFHIVLSNLIQLKSDQLVLEGEVTNCSSNTGRIDSFWKQESIASWFFRTNVLHIFTSQRIINIRSISRHLCNNNRDLSLFNNRITTTEIKRWNETNIYHSEELEMSFLF